MAKVIKHAKVYWKGLDGKVSPKPFWKNTKIFVYPGKPDEGVLQSGLPVKLENCKWVYEVK